MQETTEKKNVSLEQIISKAITLPGVKVNRKDFLVNIFEKENAVDIEKILEVGPVRAGCSQEMLARLSKNLIWDRTTSSSVISFIAGIPGGFAIFATIPADTLQFFGVSLRLAQELSYLYGEDDLWEQGKVNEAAVKNQLILYCGVMFGATGAAAGVRIFSHRLAKIVLKKLPLIPLTKKFWYKIIQKICKFITIKLTKNMFAKAVSKALPVIGGVISGGLNFASMMPMAKRLASTFEKATFDYSEAEMKADYETLRKLSEEEFGKKEQTESPVK